MKYYEVVIKNLDGDWEGLGNFKTKKEAKSFAKTINKNEYLILDINLIINDDLIKVYDINGKVR